MILAWTLLVALAADAGVEPTPILEPRPQCKPPGSWDPKTKQCKPGCGIPLRWENGVQVGGCGRDDDLSAGDELDAAGAAEKRMKKRKVIR